MFGPEIGRDMLYHYQLEMQAPPTSPMQLQIFASNRNVKLGFADAREAIGLGPKMLNSSERRNNDYSKSMHLDTKTIESHYMAKSWLQCLLKDKDDRPDDGGSTFDSYLHFIESLRDGTRLCRLMNTIAPNAITSFHEKPHGFSKKFQERENIGIFLAAARKLGVHQDDLFDTVDLYELRNEGRQTIHAIFALSRAAFRNPEFIGPFLTDTGIKSIEAGGKQRDYRGGDHQMMTESPEDSDDSSVRSVNTIDIVAKAAGMHTSESKEELSPILVEANMMDDTKAIQLYQKAANLGNVRAQCAIGFMYATGRGVEKNGAKALEWYKKAAIHGDARAQCNLGSMFANGQNVTHSNEKAVQLFKQAAQQGHTRAICNLGFMYQGGRGVPTDHERAVELYMIAADQGDSGAQYNLAVSLANGRGIMHNDAEAVRLYKLAAAQGYAKAQCALGFMYEHGRGVKKSQEMACNLYQIAAAQGEMDAAFNLASLRAEQSQMVGRGKRRARPSSKSGTHSGLLACSGKGCNFTGTVEDTLMHEETCPKASGPSPTRKKRSSIMSKIYAKAKVWG